MIKLGYILSRIPVYLFLSVVAFNFVAYNIEFSNYLKTYYVANEIIGTPLIANLFILLVCFHNQLCWYNKLSALGLLFLNIVNLIAILTPMGETDYYQLVVHSMIAPITAFVIILLIRKK